MGGLKGEEVQRKKRMLGCHHSKADINSYLYYLTEFFSMMTEKP